MRILSKPPSGWYHFLLLVITAVSRAYANGCPDDVKYDTESCFALYENQLDSVQSASSNFYSGVDVEAIRSLCSSLTSSYLCARNIRNQCPDTEYSDIETILSEKESVGSLCMYDNLYEVYAPQQWCFSQQKAESEKCENLYRASVHDLNIQVINGDEQAQTELCGHFNQLVQCISTKVKVNCGPEAAKLVEYLVRASIDQSQYCRNDSLTATTIQPTTRAVRAEPPAHGGAKDQNQVNTARSVHSSQSWRTLILLPLILLMFHILQNH